MTTTIAQTLIVTMSRGMSLTEWDRLGLLEREWAIYERLKSRYERVVIVSHGSSTDLSITSTLGPDVSCIANTQGLDSLAYVASLPARLADLGPLTSAVIKTNQMDDAGAACVLASSLRQARVPVALIARCGYLRSQFLAHEHGPGSPQAISAGLIEQTVIGAANLVVGTTSTMVDDLCWRDGLDTSHVRVIPNYVLADYPVVEAGDRDPKLLLYVGQLVERKRVDVLIRAVADLPPQPEVVLEIIGDGPEEGALRALAAELKVRAVFRPRLPHREVLDRMSRAAIYLHASALEGHPKSVIEAMSTGCSCIVADTPGLGCIVENGVTGVRVPGTAETFAYALAGVLEDECWRQQIGACAAEQVRTRFGLDRIADLEVEAHQAAFSLAQSRCDLDRGVLRWNPLMLHQDPDQIAQAWQDSFNEMLLRMPEDQRAQVRSAIATAFSSHCSAA
jgi:glycosyltransferase involved in cell wall biosynthesis